MTLSPTRTFSASIFTGQRQVPDKPRQVTDRQTDRQQREGKRLQGEAKTITWNKKGCTFHVAVTNVDDKEELRQEPFTSHSAPRGCFLQELQWPGSQRTRRAAFLGSHAFACSPGSPAMLGAPQVFNPSFVGNWFIGWLAINKCYTNKANSNVTHTEKLTPRTETTD